MNTVEPEYISNLRGLSSSELVETNELRQQCELRRTEWFLDVLKTDAISNEEEVRLQTFKELDIYGYAYVGKLKVHKYLFKLLYWLKLIKL